MSDSPTESDFDALPEAFRLALFELARREAGIETTPLTMRAIEQASATPRGTVHVRYTTALIKLRRRAEQLDLSPES